MSTSMWAASARSARLPVSRAAAVSTAPLAIAVPVAGGEPLLLDMASSVVALGKIAHDAVVVALGSKMSRHKFGHGMIHDFENVRLFDSYHCSRYNTNTGVLTPDMFREVFSNVRASFGAIA